MQECSENIDENKMTNVSLNEYKNVCSPCTIYIVLSVIFFIKSTSISNIFIHFYWYLKKSNTKNRLYYLFNDMVNIEDFDSSLDKKSYKIDGIYNIGYITIKNISHYENINRQCKFTVSDYW